MRPQKCPYIFIDGAVLKGGHATDMPGILIGEDAQRPRMALATSPLTLP